MLNTASTVIFQNALVADSEIRHPAGSAVTFLNAGSSDTVAAVAGTVTVAGDLTNNGAGSSNGGPTIIVNTAATVLFTGTQHLSALDILPGGTARMAHSGTDVLVTGSLAISSATSTLAGGLLDLADNDLIVRGGNVTNIAGLLANGFDNAWWDNAHAISGYITPAGIDSTIALADPAWVESLGYAQIGSAQGNLPPGTFDGQSVNSGDVIVKFTYYGDTNLDGNVNSTDQTTFTNGEQNQLTGWTNGDFNYDGFINRGDSGYWDNTNSLLSQLTPGTMTLAADASFPVSSLPTVTPPGATISSWLANWGNGYTQTFLPTDTVTNPYVNGNASYTATLTPLDTNGNVEYYYPHVSIKVTYVTQQAASFPALLVVNKSAAMTVPFIGPGWIDWGDRTPKSQWTTASATPSELTHTYTAIGIYTIQMASAPAGRPVKTYPSMTTTVEIPLDGPEDVGASIRSMNLVNLFWTCHDGGTGFNIYRSANGGPFLLDGTMTDRASVEGFDYTFPDTNVLAENTVYSYEVSSFDAAQESTPAKFIDPGTGSSNLRSPLIAPTNFQVTAITNSSVSFSWLNNSAYGALAKVYEMVNGRDGPVMDSISLSGASSKNTVSTMSATGQNFTAASYQFELVVTSANNCSAGAITTAITGFPYAPSNLTATIVSGTTVHLSWTEQSSNVDHFTIERSRTTPANWVTIPTGSGNATTSDDNGTSGDICTYRVTSYNSLGPSDYSNYATVSIPYLTPTIVSPAAANPSPVTGKTTLVSVLGAVPNGSESALTYSWSVKNPPPSGYAYFSGSGTNVAKNATVTFTAAGSYTLEVTIANGPATVSSDVSVVVQQTATIIDVSGAVSGANPWILLGGTDQFTAWVGDQYAYPISAPPISWKVVSGPGSINANGLYTSPASGADSAVVVQATYAGLPPATSRIDIYSKPTLSTPATATPSPVSGKTTSVSVVGAVPNGSESTLIYGWSVKSVPPGGGASFSASGTNAAKNATVTFTAAGSYTLEVTIANGPATVLSDVSVVVQQTATSITVPAAIAPILPGETYQFAATVADQFGYMISTPPISWIVVSGPGTINANGLYTSPANASNGPVVVQATYAGLPPATSRIDIYSKPTLSTPATATPSPVTGKTTSVSVLGAVPNGSESTLIYGWSVKSVPPGGGASFSASGTNAAKNATVTFTAVGSYTLEVTIANGPATVLSDVSVVVQQTATSITVPAAIAPILPGETYQFAATVIDQFGNPISSPPPLNWTIVSGSGSIDGNGLYTADSNAADGPIVVQATFGNLTSGDSTINVNSSNPAYYKINITGFEKYDDNFSGTLTVTNTNWIKAASATDAIRQAIAGTVSKSDAEGDGTSTGTFPDPAYFSITPSSIFFLGGYESYEAGNNYWSLNVKSISLALHIDSNNDGQITPADDPNKDDPTRAGKAILVNSTDLNQNQIPDYADGYGLMTNGISSSGVAGDSFAPLELALSSTVDLSKASISFAYNGSAPMSVAWTGSGTSNDPYLFNPPSSGLLRIWLKDGSSGRNGNPLVSGSTGSGDYIAPNVSYTPADLGLSAMTTMVTLYVEAVQPSSAMGDGRIQVNVNPDSSAGGSAPLTDALRTTSPLIDYVVHDHTTGENSIVDTVEPSDPRPNVSLTIIDAHIDASGQVSVTVHGEVTDQLSQLMQDPSQRVQTLYFSLNGQQIDELDNLPSMSSSGGIDTWDPYSFDVTFTRTLTFPATAGTSLVIHAETSPNAAGNTGWSDSGLSLDWVPGNEFSPGQGNNATGAGSVIVGDSGDETTYYPTIAGTENLNSSPDGTFNPAMVQIENIDQQAASNLHILLNGASNDIASFSDAGGGAAPNTITADAPPDSGKSFYMVYQGNHSQRVILVATFDSVPADVSCVKPDNVSESSGLYGAIKFSLAGKDGKPVGGVHVEVMPQTLSSKTTTPSTVPSWTMDQMLSWYQVMYGQYGLQVLQYYQQGQNLITPTHFTPNKILVHWAIGGKIWDGDWFFRTDNKVEIKIETNTDPVSAARGLFLGLQWAMGKPSFRSQIPLDGAHFQILLDSYKQAGDDAVAIGRTAAEAWLAGVQIASEPANVFVAINEAGKGNYGQAALDLLPVFAPFLAKIGKTAFKVTFQDGVDALVGLKVAAALKDAESISAIADRMAAIEQAAAQDGTALTPVFRSKIATSKWFEDIAKIGKNTSQELADNLAAAGKAKPGKIYQAHHDLPQKFRDFFVGRGLDIDKADYGRWITGGWHQEWTSTFNNEWQKFIDGETSHFANTGKYYTTDDILAMMKTLQNDVRFSPNPPIH